MNYIQRDIALAIKDKKDYLFEKYTSLKEQIIEHCKVPALNGIIVAGEDEGYLKLNFPDLLYSAYAKPRIAFDDELRPGLRINFYDDRNEWVMSLILSTEGLFSIEVKRGGPYFTYQYDDEKLPVIVIHALLTSAHQSGRIAL
ncbi:hypothetical protein [Cronobacter turicensis]|uniref:hypothetical protein n=1 Tax=Cronobacter turicensis TaxID=413502 RepID=UPI0011AD4289|nr:hypothetical protein [Cronobacter turicensis]ELU8454267.1 hypothetical protein [Cronobacter turicensis]EMA1790373.1 hypothetical protein [Cronobacter turicensis]EMA1799349.1 hypothetical protein [Cronobacter turicensis]EMA1847650.1 hypothetical protein [Cronobacter turicensis]EMA1857895.1 hypothetical protein [Cronobacter turicensis]